MTDLNVVNNYLTIIPETGNTYGEQSKRGVVIRLGIGDELQIIVQDNLTGLIALLAIAQGHEVD